MTRNIIKKTIAIITAIVLAMAAMPAKADNTQVSLLTCSPGDEVYALFGHTALRYSNPDKKIDIVFNYGIFSFEEPHFVWRFILGETDYMVTSTPYSHFIYEYYLRGSGVTEQILALDSLQKENIYKTLTDNCKRENRTYRYNYFYNNCTTKIRDKVEEQASKAAYNGEPQATTIRKAVEQHTAVQPWTSFGINLLLGAGVDKAATRETLQFLPIYLQNDYTTATINGNPLVIAEKQLLTPQEKESVPNNLTPFNCALLVLLFTMIIMLCEVRSRKIFWWYDTIMLLAQGIAGTLLLFMAFFSQHPCVDSNYLLIWLNPAALVLIPITICRAVKHKSMKFMLAQTAMVAIFLLTAPFVPQEYPTPIFIFATAYLVRSIFHIYRIKICDLSLY